MLEVVPVKDSYKEVVSSPKRLEIVDNWEESDKLEMACAVRAYPAVVSVTLFDDELLCVDAVSLLLDVPDDKVGIEGMEVPETLGIEGKSNPKMPREKLKKLHIRKAFFNLFKSVCKLVNCFFKAFFLLF